MIRTMTWILKTTLIMAIGSGGAYAQILNFVVGDSMPSPVDEHFVFTYSIKCSDSDSARIDRYEHKEKIEVVAYHNDSMIPYGYLMVHTNTLLLDNDPQDGRVDSVTIVGPENDVNICGAAPQ